MKVWVRCEDCGKKYKLKADADTFDKPFYWFRLKPCPRCAAFPPEKKPEKRPFHPLEFNASPLECEVRKDAPLKIWGHYNDAGDVSPFTIELKPVSKGVEIVWRRS